MNIFWFGMPTTWKNMETKNDQSICSNPDLDYESDASLDRRSDRRSGSDTEDPTSDPEWKPPTIRFKVTLSKGRFRSLLHCDYPGCTKTGSLCSAEGRIIRCRTHKIPEMGLVTTRCAVFDCFKRGERKIDTGYHCCNDHANECQTQSRKITLRERFDTSATKPTFTFPPMIIAPQQSISSFPQHSDAEQYITSASQPIQNVSREKIESCVAGLLQPQVEPQVQIPSNFVEPFCGSVQPIRVEPVLTNSANISDHPLAKPVKDFIPIADERSGVALTPNPESNASVSQSSSADPALERRPPIVLPQAKRPHIFDTPATTGIVVQTSFVLECVQIARAVSARHQSVATIPDQIVIRVPRAFVLECIQMAKHLH